MAILNRTGSRVDVKTIVKLSQFLGITTDRLLNKFQNENPPPQDELNILKRNNYIARHFNLAALKKEKFIKNKSDLDAVEKRINTFFGFKSIYEYTANFVFPAFSRTKNHSDNTMRDFWVKSAYLHFEKINNPNAFDPELLIDLVPKLRPYTMNEKTGLLTVIKALYSVGVTTIYQPHLTTVQARGATMLVNQKPCIVLSDLNKNYPTLWFALMHELHHVLCDLDEIQVYHLTGEPDMFLLNEDAANDFAREYLFALENRKFIRPFIYDSFIVENFAKEHEVHPSIIYDFHLWEMNEQGENKYFLKKGFNFPDVLETLENLNTNVWEQEKIDASVEIIKETIFENKNN